MNTVSAVNEQWKRLREYETLDVLHWWYKVLMSGYLVYFVNFRLKKQK